MNTFLVSFKSGNSVVYTGTRLILFNETEDTTVFKDVVYLNAREVVSVTTMPTKD